ncbi:MAG: outer membrane protein assembly factor BamD [Muribaculaceae bacterium]|nr:outer membrane protein assembly factor BamD [Muribaculaceae bacterium]
MKRSLKISILFSMMTLLLSSCGEYTKVLKSTDMQYRFEYAKKAYEQRKYMQAITLLQELQMPMRGTESGEDATFILAMSYFENKDYMNSGVYFKNYYQRYPRGKYAELARFYCGYGYYLDSPEAQLDQSLTLKAIEELEGFLDYFPNSDKAGIAKNAIFEMQDKLTLKQLQNAQLYYNLGNFLGNNYESCIITAKNALKDFPYSKYREDFEMLILKAKYQEAKNSIAEKSEDRYRDVIDEYYSFINTYPESKNLSEAQSIFNIASKHVGE